jgi:hypothetical protein
LEGFSFSGVSYVTLYDHPDKYYWNYYDRLVSKILHSASCHWRTTPSTTATYALKFRTLLQDLPVIRKNMAVRERGYDHKLFCDLGAQGKVLISSIPGWSTHVEPGLLSPNIDWEQIQALTQESAISTQ